MQGFESYMRQLFFSFEKKGVVRLSFREEVHVIIKEGIGWVLSCGNVWPSLWPREIRRVMGALRNG